MFWVNINGLTKGVTEMHGDLLPLTDSTDTDLGLTGQRSTVRLREEHNREL